MLWSRGTSGSAGRWRVWLAARNNSRGTIVALAIIALLTLGYFNPVLRGSTFSLVDGEPQSLPATRAVPVYDVTVDGDDVLVSVDVEARR